MHALKYAVIATALGLGLGMSSPSQAAQRNESSFVNPGMACQLSIPTTNTGVRPRATGYRNEGTSAAFVICGFQLPTGDSDLTRITIGFNSVDGAAHSFNCTAVNGIPGYSTLTYVTKTANVPATGYTFLEYNPADFGGTTTIPTSYVMSVTCNLPASTAIIFTESDYAIEIGS